MIEAFEKLSLTSSQYYTQLSTSQFSERLINTPPIRKLDSIIISNFKSFSNNLHNLEGKVYVGPLLDFTSIIGPNGAGKSNILDALMFCLCNEKNKLTFYDIREFIQRDGNETYNEMSQKNKFCEVEANFILDSERKLSFRRTLYPNENQEFSIDGEAYKQSTYENFLMRCNINHITSNFAIWQG
jgi:structural maintenance of chromosome 1